MNDDEINKVTICIVNYKTKELTKLCLRSIRKFTKYPYQVIVVDNNSNDESLEYLRNLSWIKLIERPNIQLSGSEAHGTALDLALSRTDTKYFLAMHSDTFVFKEGWLKWMVDQINISNYTACAGSGKLDLKPRWQTFLKKATDVKSWIRKLKTDNPNKHKFYIRAICALYRADILRQENLGFSLDVDKGMTCGKQLYFKLLEKNYKVNVISEFKMSEFIYHLAHATMVFNPEFEVRNKTERKCKAKLESVMSKSIIQEVAQDSSLDN